MKLLDRLILMLCRFVLILILARAIPALIVRGVSDEFKAQRAQWEQSHPVEAALARRIKAAKLIGKFQQE